MIMMKPWIALLALAPLCGCSSTAPTRPAEIARGDEQALKTHLSAVIAHEMHTSRTAGLSIVLIDDQRIVWQQGFGVADVERQAPATAQTLYRVGSISKLFTVAAALQLAERGRLDLDAPVRQTLPDFRVEQWRPTQAEITPRLLMTHHAGLPRDRLKGFMTANPAPFDSVLADLRGEIAPARPGEVFAYSNLGIGVLGATVQQTAGQPFALHLRQALLEPLGMKDASFEAGPSDSPRMARGHLGREPRVEPSLRDVPAGGLNASAEDLGRFIAMVFAGGEAGGRQILKPETVAEMLRPQNDDVPLDMGFRVGLGWMLSTLGRSTIRDAGPVAHHAGATAYFQSQLYLLPQHKLGVAVLANSSTARQAVDRVATEALALALQMKTGIRQPPFVVPPRSGEPVPAALREAMAGDYTTLAGPLRVVASGTALKADIGGRRFELVPRSDGLLALEYALLGILRVDLGPLSDAGLSLRRIDGRELLVARVGEQEMLVGEKLGAPPPLGAWAQRLGDYELLEPDAEPQKIEGFRLFEDRGFLVAQLKLGNPASLVPRLVVRPVSDAQAAVLGVLAEGGEAVRVQTVDGEERLLLSGYQARRARALAVPR